MSEPPQHAIVTGGARGLGREFCRCLAKPGCQIAIVDIDRTGAEETAAIVARAGAIARVEVCDVTSFDAWLLLRERLKFDWPRLNLVVNNAGMYASGNIGTLDIAEAERLLRLNLNSVLYGCHAMVPWLTEHAKTGPAAVINVASSFAFLCPPGMAPYNLSKAAVIALSETLHSELKPRGVGVTVVCPGPMPTRFIENASFETDKHRLLTETYVRESTLDPAAVAAASLEASWRKQLYVVLGADQRWFWRAKRLMPAAFLSRVARKVRKDLARVAGERQNTHN